MIGKRARSPGRRGIARNGDAATRFMMVVAVAVAVATAWVAVSPEIAGAHLLRASAAAERAVVLRGEPVVVAVTVESDGFSPATVETPTVAGLFIERAGTSQNLVMAAGSMVRTDVALFNVTAALVGKHTIPGFWIELDRKRTQTGPVNFETVASLPSGGALPGEGGGGRSEVFARLVVDRHQVYWNEQVVARVQVYSRGPLEDMPTWEPPDAPSFWSEPIGNPKHDRVLIEGRPYERYERAIAFFPTRPGRLTLGPARARVRVMQMNPPTRDPMGGFFPAPPAEVVEVPLEAAPVDIAVDPLPAGAPAGFHGAVGHLELGVRVDRPRVKVGEPITVSTWIRGDGNLASASDPAVVARPAAPSYPAGARTDLDRSGDRVRGVRRRDVAFVPEHAGSLLVLPIEFAWFDPEEGRYRMQRSDTITVRVEPGTGSGALDSDLAQTAFAVPAPSRAAGAKGARGDLAGWPTGIPLAAGFLSLSAYVAFGLAAAARRRRANDPAWRRARLASEAADRVAAAAHAGDPKRAAERTEAALRDAAGVRFGIDPEGRSRRDLLERLRAAGVEPAAIEELMDILGRLERGAFAPGGSAETARVLREAVALAHRWRASCRR